jgi:two-component system, NarL family, nitrate/nitrite response regulator NarL
MQTEEVVAMTTRDLPSPSPPPGDSVSCRAAPIRLLLIGAYRLLWAGVRAVLKDQPGVRIVGEAADPEAAYVLAVNTCPTLLLFDLQATGASGLDHLSKLQAAAPQAQVLMLASAHEAEHHHRAVLLGVRGIVCKEQPVEVLVQAITAVHAGEVWLDAALLAHVLTTLHRGEDHAPQDPEAAKITALSAREREVITLVGQGLKNQAIAARLCIAESTVRHHLSTIFAKLDVADRLALVIYAYCHGLARLPR